MKIVTLIILLISKLTFAYENQPIEASQSTTYLDLFTGERIQLSQIQVESYNNSLKLVQSIELSDTESIRQLLLTEDSSKLSDIKRTMFVHKILSHNSEISWIPPQNPSIQEVGTFKLLDQFVSTNNFINSIGVLKRSVWMEILSNCRLMETIKKPNRDMVSICRGRIAFYKSRIIESFTEQVDEEMVTELLSALEFEQNYKGKGKVDPLNWDGMASRCDNCEFRLRINAWRPFKRPMRRMNFSYQIVILASKL